MEEAWYPYISFVIDTGSTLMFRYVRLRTPPCADAIRIARLAREINTPSVTFVSKWIMRGPNVGPTAHGSAKHGTVRPDAGVVAGRWPMIASAPCIYAMPEVFCHLASQMAAGPISRRPEIVRRNDRNDSEPRACTTHTQ